MSIPINLVYEDELSEFVMNRLLSCFNGKFFSATSYNGRGFGYIKSSINGFNQACVAIPFFVLTDLDAHTCPISLLSDWFKSPKHSNMIFRIAVREVEAWLLGNREGFANYNGISTAHIPNHPERISDPKRTLISIVSKSRKRSIREDIIPINQNASIGPNYNGRLMEFVLNHWNIERAMENCESLLRAYSRLDEFNFKMPN